MVAAVLLVEEGDRLVLLDAATGATSRTVTLAAVSRTTGGTAPYLWAGAGYTDAGRLLIATDDGVVRLSRGGRLLGSVPWPRRVFDDGSFLVWPDGRVSVGGLGGLEDPTGNPTGSSAVVIDTERPGAAPREVAGVVRAVDRRARRVAVTRSTPSGARLLLMDTGGFEPVSNAWPGDPETEVVRFSADGSQMLVGAGEHVELRDGASGAPIRDLAGHNGGGGGGRVRRSRRRTCCGPPGATGPRWPST